MEPRKNTRAQPGTLRFLPDRPASGVGAASDERPRSRNEFQLADETEDEKGRIPPGCDPPGAYSVRPGEGSEVGMAAQMALADTAESTIVAQESSRTETAVSAESFEPNQLLEAIPVTAEVLDNEAEKEAELQMLRDIEKVKAAELQTLHETMKAKEAEMLVLRQKVELTKLNSQNYHQQHYEFEPDECRYVFVYGSLRPDDESNKSWNQDAVSGMLGQWAELRGAHLYNDKYANVVFEGAKSEDTVYGWVLTAGKSWFTKRLKLFDLLLGQTGGSYERTITKVWLLGDPKIGPPGSSVMAYVYHIPNGDKSEENLIPSGDWLLRNSKVTTS
ncbi:expressed unknown protein [Seminavis robusta]|uniref:Gamma-glutamylcyclotransferase AIG2-like domain-containing protein n=1 Tax=Seminavis robusta TaxID=568900 RepID=A0A9N8DJX3_9STRA|nr:expressed unknown protein [Seminavis robusta]|eukprot:Sro124_g059850.1 n/a (332) ;mRNA; r:42763-43758